MASNANSTIAPSRRTFLGQVAAAAAGSAVVGTTAAIAAQPHPDAELLRLGYEFDEAWAAERAVSSQDRIDDAACDAAFARTGLVVGRIEKISARTMEGLQVKARAVSWCHCGEPMHAESFAGSATTDIRLAAGILDDLLAIVSPTH